MKCPNCLEFINKEGKKAPKHIELKILMENSKIKMRTCPECGLDFVEYKNIKKVNYKK